MNKLYVSVSTFIAVTSFAGAYYYAVNSLVVQTKTEATAENVEGEIFIKEPYSPSWTKLESGQQIAAGTLISSAALSSVRIFTTDGFYLKIHERSKVVLGDTKSGFDESLSINLLQGFIETILPNATHKNKNQSGHIHSNNYSLTLPQGELYAFFKKDNESFVFGSTNQSLTFNGSRGENLRSTVGIPLEIKITDSGEPLLLKRLDDTELARLLEVGLDDRLAALHSIEREPQRQQRKTSKPLEFDEILELPQHLILNSQHTNNDLLRTRLPNTADNRPQDLNQQRKTSRPQKSHSEVSGANSNQPVIALPLQSNSSLNGDSNKTALTRKQRTKNEIQASTKEDDSSSTNSKLAQSNKKPAPRGIFFLEGGKIAARFIMPETVSDEQTRNWLNSSERNLVITGALDEFAAANDANSFFRSIGSSTEINLWNSGKIYSVTPLLFLKFPGVLEILKNTDSLFYKKGLQVKSSKGSPTFEPFQQATVPQLDLTTELKKAKTAVILVDKNGGASVSSMSEVGFTSTRFFESFQSRALNEIIKTDPSSALDAASSDEKMVNLLTTIRTKENADLLVAIFEQANGDFIGRIAGIHSNQAAIVRSFQVVNLSSIQKAFENTLGFDGVTTATGQGMVKIELQNSSAKVGRFAILISKTNPKTWLPIINTREAPLAFLSCLKPIQNGCLSRVISTFESNSANLVGAKVKWL